MRTVSQPPRLNLVLSSDSAQMISEVVGDKRNQTRAFLLLPMAGNVGIIIGPLLGSLLATPVDESSEDLKSAINHRSRHQWMRDYPYALPNVINAVFLSCAAAFLFFGLNEVIISRPPVNRGYR